MIPTPRNVLQLLDIEKSYPGVKALDKINLDFKSGEVHALVGENGAGKSTLARIIAGLEQQDVGRMIFKGRDYSPRDKRTSEKQGIRIVMQELSLISTLSVAENIFFNRLPTRLGLIDRKQLADDTAAIISKVGLKQLHADSPVGSLGVGQQQMVEIAAGLSESCKLLILDEPTAALTDSEIEHLFKQIQQLKQKEVCIIYISHRMEEIKKISDRVTILRDGAIRGTREAVEFDMKEMIRLMVGRTLGDVHPPEIRPQCELALQAKNLGRKGVLHDVSFDLFQGEILGFSGMMGSGRSELMRLLFGADQKDSGEIYLRGSNTPRRIHSPKDAVNAGLAMLTEDRKAQGLLLPLSIAANISLAKMDAVSSRGWLHPSKEESVSKRYIKQLSIRCHSVDQRVKTLSGGNQQKVVMAKWLYTEPEILIFDEPTRGIDVGAKFEIYNLLKNLAREGRAIIVVSSDMLELFAISDRIAVMSNGALANIFTRGDWSEDKIMQAALSNYMAGKAG
ncbi:MAG: sugar ABC transporter ATP-binding protein [Candidatus Marinimicrobia bacterium]|nr:sugar ABC transporter ATP-binding protein [Candidatus Neomarinimicrobiota bacterium]MBT3631276.1 sugar ABC transporter ATP-binding protein [Candidatus Neomarinimicrobiota bacterium]MBT3824784.1 sugar ABC transporter ATP-binding protein [Candidatus Neomarinimicrobiota bacterium]MBT4132062.1 sugar ABC transporter ATP-binding protein [Candidatus Neomarinimicrobiota bacterium]MBT4296177.1 sugar ABC transporter ATP-binding protein [Candidatus Neomarinimicrobiota bacterium]